MRHPLRASPLVALALAAFLVGGEARAQRPADKPAAQKLLTKGNQAVGEGDYLKALELFKKAHGLFPSPKILVNIGSTARLLGRYSEAAAAYEAFLADPAADKARVNEVTRALKEIDAVTARVRIVVRDSLAHVHLDGKEIPEFASGATLRIEPGEHTIVASREGFPPVLRTLTVKPSELVEVTLEIKPAEKVEVIVVAAGPQRAFGFVIGGVGAAGVLAGLGVGGAALAARRASEGHCFRDTLCDAKGADDGSRAHRLGNVSTGVFLAGVGLLGVGAVLLATAPSATPKDAAKAVAFSLRPASIGAGAEVEVAW